MTLPSTSLRGQGDVARARDVARVEVGDELRAERRETHGLDVFAGQLGHGRLEGYEDAAHAAAQGGVVKVLEQDLHVEDLAHLTRRDRDAALGVDLDARVHGRSLGPREQFVEPGGSALVAEGQGVRVGVVALVDAEHAGHVPGLSTTLRPR